MSRPYRRSPEWIDSLPEPLRSHMRASTMVGAAPWRRRGSGGVAASDDPLTPTHPPRDERPQTEEGTEPSRRH